MGPRRGTPERALGRIFRRLVDYDDVAVRVVEKNLLPAGHRPIAVIRIFDALVLETPLERIQIVGAKSDVAALHGIDHLASTKTDIHVLFGDVHLYRAVGDEGDVSWIALVSHAVATHVGNCLHVENVSIEFVHHRDVCGGQIDMMHLQLHEVAFRSAATSSRADFNKYCRSDPTMTKRAPSLTNSETCSTSPRIPPTPSCLPCALQAFAVLSYAARSFGLFISPGIPIAVHRSLEPISSTSMPGTAAIASAFAIPSGLSSIGISSVAAFPCLLTSPRDVGRKPCNGPVPATERSPSGGNRHART